MLHATVSFTTVRADESERSPAARTTSQSTTSYPPSHVGSSRLITSGRCVIQSLASLPMTATLLSPPPQVHEHIDENHGDTIAGTSSVCIRHEDECGDLWNSFTPMRLDLPRCPLTAPTRSAAPPVTESLPA